MIMVLTGSLRPQAAGAASQAQILLHSAFRSRVDKSFPPICRLEQLPLARSKERSAPGWRFRPIASKTPRVRPRAIQRRCSRFRPEAFFLWGDLKDIKGL